MRWRWAHLALASAISIRTGCRATTAVALHIVIAAATRFDIGRTTTTGGGVVQYVALQRLPVCAARRKVARHRCGDQCLVLRADLMLAVFVRTACEPAVPVARSSLSGRKLSADIGLICQHLVMAAMRREAAAVVLMQDLQLETAGLKPCEKILTSVVTCEVGMPSWIVVASYLRRIGRHAALFKSSSSTPVQLWFGTGPNGLRIAHGTDPAMGKDLLIRLSTAGAKVVLHPPPLSPAMLISSYPASTA
eukprot:CAMPEP_0181178468 /NCGR_PEP_ID=MMETSP1096-20121128/5739_1 /TAXON_ID=156174 ORGANISM="Chrysochromulina ericina, Strain CCMP281" /NCGR_SAMPLE_ID=MMETSP1096 /ASSEMBLY_ACC=CAM_ASM_000453 /LENGTH=248 /DNA_ID=CAMNT_0023266745 /DNA_START=35 /DNA_END=783 /DNA_ORIENTATION=-